ncbi:MAG: GntR family transcriptional regulator [Betaproteobacteria bacterium RIFCSPLOWO2_12_FULL_62_13]|nr:MAG: GntR family transcriptional regulator [Betaproteobacteria bacterium RIFCSPLOWO2_12_FULL_62_13]
MTFKTKEEYVAEYLREGILSGRFPRGAHLKQAEIAEELKLSITPVREAFRILEAEGYVLSETHRGVIVAPFDASATREINDLRVLLESRLVLAAMEQMTPAHHAGLARLQREFEEAEAGGDREAVRALNYRFHSYLYALARQPQTLHFVQVLWAKYPFDLINLIRGRPSRAAAEHRRLLKAVKAGDKKAAVKAVREHIEAGWRELQSHLSKQAPATLPKAPQSKTAPVE